MRFRLQRYQIATGILAFAGLGFALASIRVAQRTDLVRAPFVTDPNKLATMARQALPGVQVVVAGPATMDYVVRVKDRVVLSPENWPSQYPMYRLGPVLPLGQRQVLVGLQKASRILRFSLGGQFLGEVGRGPGNGPGEIMGPFRAFADVSDSSVWVYSPGNALLQHFDNEGGYLFSVRLVVPQFLVRDFAVDSRRQLVYLSFWDWDRKAPVHVYDLSGEYRGSFGRGPYIHKGENEHRRLVRNMGFWENYAGGHLFPWKSGIWFARSSPYELCLFDSLRKEKLVIFRSAKFVTPPAYRHMGGLNFVGPYASQITAVGVVESYLLVWFVSDEPNRSGSTTRSVLDVLSLDGQLLASKRWEEDRWVWSFGPGCSFFAGRRVGGREEILHCQFEMIPH